MDLQVYVSKKGTKVVLATDLHQALELPKQHYATDARKWLNDLYEFEDGIRKPLRLQDFAPRSIKENPVLDDYYLTTDFAKQIVLHSRSKVKQKYAKFLAEQSEGRDWPQLSQEQFMHIVELTKAMQLVSAQEASEREHLRMYKSRNNGEAAGWWRYRASVLGYDADELRDRLRRRGKSALGKNQRQLLASVDRYELIRAGVIDLFMSIGKSEHYARRMGDLAKTLASEMKVEIIDDRQSADLFSQPAGADLVHRLQQPTAAA